jgi:hypothetical protein
LGTVTAGLAVGGGMSTAGGLGVTMAAAGMGYTAGTFVTSVGNNLFFHDPMPTQKQYLQGLAFNLITAGVLYEIAPPQVIRDTRPIPDPIKTPTVGITPSDVNVASEVNTAGEVNTASQIPISNASDEGIYVLNNGENSSLTRIQGDEIKFVRDPNFRQNLIKSSGIDPGSEAQAHHLFPVKYAEYFNKVGVDVNRYGAWWETSSHLQNAFNYNQAWGEFIINNPTPNKMQILQEALNLKSIFGY